MASANPAEEYFGQLAKQYSVEPASQNNNGQVPPIRRHSGRPDLEEEAFALKTGEISKVVQVGEYYIILYCQGMTEPVVTEFDAVKEHLYQDILEKKLRLAMEDEFLALRGDAQIDNFLAGTSQSGKALRAAAKQAEQRGQQR
jgi:parvulin-like peptidyl-prolyl isomerase